MIDELTYLLPTMYVGDIHTHTSAHAHSASEVTSLTKPEAEKKITESRNGAPSTRESRWRSCCQSLRV